MMKKAKRLHLLEIFSLLLGLVWLAPFYLMVVNAFKTKKGIFSDVLGLPDGWNICKLWSSFC